MIVTSAQAANRGIVRKEELGGPGHDWASPLCACSSKVEPEANWGLPEAVYAIIKEDEH
jgi:hypothetical protein